MNSTSKLSRVTIYTDGSCLGNPGPGGWSAILIHNGTGTEKAISGGEPMTTNNRMEITAAIQALSALKRPVEVDIYSDSNYLVNAFVKGWLDNWCRRGWVRGRNKPVENLDLWQELVRCAAPHQIHWHHVSAHRGHQYNERCDQMARAEASKFK